MTVVFSWLMFSMMATQGSAPVVQDLASFKWENRIILVYRAEDIPQTVAALKQADEQIVDRHILWFVLTGQGGVQTNYPRPIGPDFIADVIQRYFQNPLHSVVLIGKDGGVKDACSRLDLPYLFYLIDQMPMRQQEMRS